MGSDHRGGEGFYGKFPSGRNQTIADHQFQAILSAGGCPPRRIANKATLSAIQEKFEEIYPEQIFTASFLDESIAAFYESEQKLALVYKIFAVLAILISCIGLYGLVSFMVGQKLKEIGIRKVLGASFSQITYMLSKEFIIMVMIAFGVAIPLAYFMMREWLQTFAYKTPVSVWLFVAVMLV